MLKNHRLVLLSCCAPCSAGAIAELKEQGIDFCVLFYNPNIYPEIEYIKRLDEQIRYCEEIGIKYAVPEYDHNEWIKSIRGLENEPERGKRCAECFKHRFKFAVKFAADNGYNAIASVLGVSKHKDQAQVDACANYEITELHNDKITYLPIDWDEALRRKINQEHNFYRQNYCGCEFSIRDAKISSKQQKD